MRFPEAGKSRRAGPCGRRDPERRRRG